MKKNKIFIINLILFAALLFPFIIYSQQADEGVSYIYAKKLYDDEMYQLAAEQFHIFAEDNPMHPRASESLQMAGLSYFKAGEYSSALKEYTYLIIKYPDAENLDQAQFKIAECFQLTSDFPKAARAYRQVQIFYPKSNLAEKSLLLASEMHTKTGDYQRASQILFEFLEIYPRSKFIHEAQIALVNAYIADEKFNFANTQIEKILGTTEKGEFNAKALYLKGEILFLQENHQGAENLFEELGTKYSNTKDPNITEILNAAYSKLSEILFQKGLYQKSNENILKITSLKNDINSLKLQAQNYFFLKNYAEAIHILTSIISIADSSELANIHYQIGLNYDSLNDYTKAVEFYTKVIELKNEIVNSEDKKLFFSSYLKISYNYLKMNQPLAAIKSLKDYINAADNNLPVDEQQFKIGYLYETELNDYERSIRIYYDFLDSYPRSRFVDDANFAIARCFEKKSEFQNAVKTYNDFLNTFPASDLYANAKERIGYITKYYQTVNETTKSLTNLISQLSEENQNPQVIFQLGIINFTQFKDYGTSIQLFKKCYVNDTNKAVNKAELLFYWGRAYQLLGEKDVKQNKAYLDSAKTTFNLLIENFSDKTLNAKSKYHLIEIHDLTANPQDSSYNKTKKQLLTGYKIEFPESPFIGQVELTLGKLMLIEGIKSPVDSMEIHNHFDSAIQKASDSSVKQEAEFKKALLFLKLKNINSAMNQLKKFIEKYPNSPNSYKAKFELAKLNEQQGELPAARKILENFISEYFYSTYSDSARFMIGRIYQKEENYSEALRFYKQVYSDNQSSGQNFGQQSGNLTFQESLVGIAESHLNTGNMESAIIYFQRYLELFPKGALADKVLYSLANIYSTNKNVEQKKAIDFYLRLESQFPQSSLIFNTTKNVADLFFVVEDFNNAIEYYKKALSYSAEKTEFRAEISSQIIICYYRLGNIQTADQQLKNFRSGYKDELALISNMELEKGDYFLKNKNFNQAEDIFKEVRSKYKNLENGAKAEYLLGKLNFILNKDEDALEILTKMIGKYPNDPIIPEVYITLGNFYYFQARQIENAMLAYRKVVDFPKIDESTLKMGMHNLIKCYTDLGLRDPAIALIRRYIDHFPESEDVFDKKVRMGIIFSELNEYDQAIQLFQTLKPEADLENEPRIQYWIGECYFNKGQYTKAISEYLKIVYLSKPTKLLNQYRVTAQFKSGLAYLKINEPEKGKVLFEKIVQEQGAESVFGKPALEKINEIKLLLANNN